MPYLIQIIKDNVRITTNGKLEIYNRGDWLEVSRQTATNLVAENKGRLDKLEGLIDANDLSVISNSSSVEVFFKNITFVSGFPKTLKSKRNIFLDAGYNFRDKTSPFIIQNPAKFSLLNEYLKKWDVVLILASYEDTIFNRGVELEACKAVLPELRIPYYQNCVVGIANTPYGKKFYSAWTAEKSNGEIHALTRALFQVNPTLQILPPNWGLL